MSVLDNITPEEIERDVRKSPIIHAAVMAERERCAKIAESIRGMGLLAAAEVCGAHIADVIRGKDSGCYPPQAKTK